jgi:hypothetical protein
LHGPGSWTNSVTPRQMISQTVPITQMGAFGHGVLTPLLLFRGLRFFPAQAPGAVWSSGRYGVGESTVVDPGKTAGASSLARLIHEE